ncbi:hypothetical protein K505DRAFT_335668 [Melanomma pulvis-pyrius CBS 109.77]|uniref:Uncharacterized protein n=1 Tax=Melanomma pulvis-pyrius CBS 109.77 TaxID=1314802 RepID=A0A6A6XI60_9PLEO|nr:hypothetical protein K505DRAFT_335668 [Melanomma pulvis-pyrius CBS 109.77]
MPHTPRRRPHRGRSFGIRRRCSREDNQHQASTSVVASPGVWDVGVHRDHVTVHHWRRPIRGRAPPYQQPSRENVSKMRRPPQTSLGIPTPAPTQRRGDVTLTRRITMQEAIGSAASSSVGVCGPGLGRGRSEICVSWVLAKIKASVICHV